MKITVVTRQTVETDYRYTLEVDGTVCTMLLRAHRNGLLEDDIADMLALRDGKAVTVNITDERILDVSYENEDPD